MQAARLDLDSRTLAVRDVPVPDPPPGWVRVKVAACGVCLTDIHLITGVTSGLHKHSGEVTLGHEISGEVDVVGLGVQGWSAGDRVTVSLLHQRPEGEFTIGVDFDGGWADYVVTPASTLVRIPDSLPFDIAAIVPDAISTPWAAVTETASVAPGEAVALWGIGGVGTHAVQILRYVGAAPIIAVDTNEAARRRAIAHGADHAIDPTAVDAAEEIARLTGGRGVDVAFDFVGSSAVEKTMLGTLAPSGRAVFVGVNMNPLVLDIPALMVIMKHQIRGHFANGPSAIPTILRLTDLGRLDFSGSISGHVPLTRVADAVEQLEKKIGDPIRLVIVPDDRM